MAYGALYGNQGRKTDVTGDLFIQQPAHLEVDLSNARRVFVFGDVHGHLANLVKAMDRNGYDAEAGDRLIGLGDWLDRGEDTIEVANFIAAHRDDLVFVKGNHEQMLEDSFTGRPGGFGGQALISNGGAWITNYIDMDALQEDDYSVPQPTEDGRRILSEVCGAPVALTVTMPSGKKVGIVHAEVRRIFGSLDWNAFTGVLEEQGEHGSFADEAMWGRQEIKDVRQKHLKSFHGQTLPDSDDYVANIDHVFHGHTILRDVLTWGNRTWLDIGSYAGPRIGFINIDEHIRMH